MNIVNAEGEINNTYQSFIAKSRYARWLPDEGRRETWQETVDRYISFWVGKGMLSGDEIEELRNAILNMEVMPSMRALMTAGPALDRDNVAGYNCSYLAMNRQRAFDELMYVLMCGTGVGFSVERQEVSLLPTISEEMHESDTTIVVGDSKIGWASAFRELISLLYAGKIPKWDLSKIRPAGATLKTFGGRASGPEPLNDLFKYAVALFKQAAGRKLTSIEVHGLVCKIAEIVVVGGVRRSACISLSDLTDNEMSNAKMGEFWKANSQRRLSNNSVAYTRTPDTISFLKEWTNLIMSRSGERGIFNRVASTLKGNENNRRNGELIEGTNPCLVGDTLITTDKGDVPIKDIVDGNVQCRVITFNTETQELEEEEIVRAIKTKENADVIKLELDDGEVLELTPDHKVYTENRGYIKASQLTEDWTQLSGRCWIILNKE